MNERAVALALQALYAALSEEQQWEVRSRLYHDAYKHEKPTVNEDDAMELLRGWA